VADPPGGDAMNDFRYLTLGGIIAALEAEDPARILPYGFNEPHSYRGHYEELAFEPAENITVGEMLAACRSALGATFQGWKGGDYTMDADTECWIAVRGETSDNRIGPLLLKMMLAQADAGSSRSAPVSDLTARLASALRVVAGRFEDAAVEYHNRYKHAGDWESCADASAVCYGDREAIAAAGALLAEVEAVTTR